MRHQPQGEHKAKAALLDQAIRAARAPREERLSGDARASIVAAAAQGRLETRPAQPLFRPFWQVLGAAVAPVALGVALLVSLGPTGSMLGNQPGPGSDAIQVHALKVGDRVVFTIDNGAEEHTVNRSEDPTRFDPASAVKVTDSYAEKLENGSNLVFYRIN
ncbi:hypothetical protein ABI59_03785 [Acidobacteria bacterium Mor1]|nr:hypothetical protein ABI59_03785 [Acidobacteria bacterium Mor1]